MPNNAMFQSAMKGIDETSNLQSCVVFRPLIVPGKVPQVISLKVLISRVIINTLGVVSREFGHDIVVFFLQPLDASLNGGNSLTVVCLNLSFHLFEALLLCVRTHQSHDRVNYPPRKV